MGTKIDERHLLEKHPRTADACEHCVTYAKQLWHYGGAGGWDDFFKKVAKDIATPVIRRYARRLPHHLTAADALQVFTIRASVDDASMGWVKLYYTREITQPRPRSLVAFLRNKFRNWLKEECEKAERQQKSLRQDTDQQQYAYGRRKTPTGKSALVSKTRHGHNCQVEEGEAMVRLLDKLDLPQNVRRTVELLLQGDNQKEIACRLGVAESTVSRRLQQAKDAYRAWQSRQKENVNECTACDGTTLNSPAPGDTRAPRVERSGRPGAPMLRTLPAAPLR